jgi:multimeric flavodoxin WrbA
MNFDSDACVFSDDFNELARLVEQADMIVFATPLYWYTFSSQLKTALDKFHSFLVGQKTLKIRHCVLLSTCGGPAPSSFDGLVTSYKAIAGLMKWESIGMVLVPSMPGKTDVASTDALARAEALGKSVA